MALSRPTIRKILTQAGTPEEGMEAAITQIATANTESLDFLKDENDKLKAQLKEAGDNKTELDALKEKIKTDYVPKTDFEKVKKEYDDYKSDISAKATKAATEKAVKAYFDSKGIKGDNLDLALMAVESRMSEFELDGEKLKDTKSLDELIGGKLSRLVEKTEKIGLDVNNNPPQNYGGAKPPSRAAQLAAQYHDSLYGAVQTANQPKGE